MKKKYAMFIGRFQTPRLHDGHLWLFRQKLDEGVPVLIAVREVEQDEKNPYTAEQVKDMICGQLSKEVIEGRVRVICIPDIIGIYYGRDVGYEVVELKPPPEIAAVSATAIRNEMKNNNI